MKEKNNICAVIVTYNRINLLKKSLESVDGQTASCDILVVNNNSSDGTKEYLEINKITHIDMKENIGGAGGFNRGIKTAVLKGYDYLWIMDDDCVPENDALEKLIKNAEDRKNDFGWLSSRCLWKDGTQCRMNLQRKTPYKDIKLDNKGMISAQMASFVSLFIKTSTILEYGLPISDFFVWGDDWEFTRRISLKNECFVSYNSIVTHLMERNNVVDISVDSKDRISRYFFSFRNDVFIYRREGVAGFAWLLAKNVWNTAKVIMRAKDNRNTRIRIIWRGFFEGLNFLPEIEYVEN